MCLDFINDFTGFNTCSYGLSGASHKCFPNFLDHTSRCSWSSKCIGRFSTFCAIPRPALVVLRGITWRNKCALHSFIRLCSNILWKWMPFLYLDKDKIFSCFHKGRLKFEVICKKWSNQYRMHNYEKFLDVCSATQLVVQAVHVFIPVLK